jgi:hypothetical protein
MHTCGIVSLFLQYLLASYIKMYKYDFGVTVITGKKNEKPFAKQDGLND